MLKHRQQLPRRLRDHLHFVHGVSWVLEPDGMRERVEVISRAICTRAAARVV